MDALCSARGAIVISKLRIACSSLRTWSRRVTTGFVLNAAGSARGGTALVEGCILEAARSAIDAVAYIRAARWM